MNKGGYQILDLNGIVFDDSERYAIDGIFNKISETRKPVLITNFTLRWSNNIKMRDVFAEFRLEIDEIEHETYYLADIDLPLVNGFASSATIQIFQSDEVQITYF